MRERFVRRVTWKVRRGKGGWWPVVLLGEEPIRTSGPYLNKADARSAARKYAQFLKNAGQ